MMAMHMSWVAIIVAAVASVVWGWIWHTWVCGKKWASECGMHRSMNKNETVFATLVSFVGAILTAYVICRLLHLSQTAHIMPSGTSYKHAFCVALTVWIGFYIPMTLNATVWMKKQWQFFIAKVLNQFVHLLIIAMILAHWSRIR